MTQGLKELAGSRSPKFGHFIVEFATPGIGHILKSAGCDFVLFAIVGPIWHIPSLQIAGAILAAIGLALYVFFGRLAARARSR